MQKIYKLLDEVDNVILSSPNHFSQVSGMLLGLSSRFQRYYAQRSIRKIKNYSLKRKNAVLILTGGGDGSPESAIAHVKILVRQINAELIGTISRLRPTTYQQRTIRGHSIKPKSLHSN